MMGYIHPTKFMTRLPIRVGFTKPVAFNRKLSWLEIFSK